MGGGTLALFAVLALAAAGAPIILAVSEGRALPIFLAILLTVCAVITMTVAKGFGDATFVVGAWTGAMICGFAAYIDGSLGHHVKTLIKGLPKPDHGLEHGKDRIEPPTVPKYRMPPQLIIIGAIFGAIVVASILFG